MEVQYRHSIYTLHLLKAQIWTQDRGPMEYYIYVNKVLSSFRLEVLWRPGFEKLIPYKLDI